MLIFNTKKIDFMLECLEEAVEDHIESNIIIIQANVEMQNKIDNLIKRLDKLEKKLDNNNKVVRKVKKCSKQS